MPDHLHVLLSFPAVERMDKVIRDWKRCLAKRAGVTWQDGFFDHRVRNHEGCEEKADYIRQNPVRAGLTGAASQWPYVWEFAHHAPAR
jgi:REP element-mobilizing transposase RayT